MYVSLGLQFVLQLLLLSNVGMLSVMETRNNETLLFWEIPLKWVTRLRRLPLCQMWSHGTLGDSMMADSLMEKSVAHALYIHHRRTCLVPIIHYLSSCYIENKSNTPEKRDCSAINRYSLLFGGSSAQVCGWLDARFSPCSSNYLAHYLTLSCLHYLTLSLHTE